MRQIWKEFYAAIFIASLFLACEQKMPQKDDDQAAADSSESGSHTSPGSDSSVEEKVVQTLKIEAEAPDFSLPGIDGRHYSLNDFESAEVLVVIFTCNHCPTAQAYEDRIIALVNHYMDDNVRIVAISPNSVKTLLFEEMGYTDLGDSFEEMKIRAQNKKFNFVYLFDGDSQQTSIKYGPVATPHAFVFDKDRKLKYSGRIDGSEKPGTANADDLRNAIDAVLLNSDILQPVTKTFGCSVKWAWKSEWSENVNAEWIAKPVKLQDINTIEVKELMKNPTDKLMLINVWATWCGPCVIEFPELVNIHRMYMGREFEFVSLSADRMSQRDKAQKFLSEKNAAFRNYIFSGSDVYKLIDVIDPEWDGALPYTALVEPGGKIVYKKMGSINPTELKRIIVEHPMIGRYY